MTTLTAVAGGGNWTTAATWSPAQTPTAADDCVLTSTSGNVTVDAGAVARSVNCTSYTGTLTHTSAVTLTIGDGTAGAGNVALLLVAGMTYTKGNATTSAVSFVSTSTTQQTIWCGGKTLGTIIVNGAGGSWLFADAFATAGTFTLTAGNLDTGGQPVTSSTLNSSNSNVRSLTLGTTTWTLTATTGTVFSTSTTANLTLSAASSTIVVATASSSTRSFATGSSQVHGSLVYTVAGSTGPLNIANGTPASFNDITFSDVSNARTVHFASSATYTIRGSFNVNGTAGKLMTVDASTAGTAFTLTKTSGVVSCDYLSIKDSTAGGGAAWYAGANSTSVSGNTGWVFTAAPATSTPAVVTATTAMPAAAVTAVVAVTPSPVTAGVDVPAVGVDVGQTAAPAAVAAAVTVPAVQVTTTVTPAAVAAVTTMPAPQGSASTLATPTTIAATVAMPAVSVTAGTSGAVAPATITTTTAMPAVDVATSAVATPAVITATSAVSGPQVAGSAEALPDTIAAAVTMGAGEVGVVTATHPATIVTAITMPTALGSASAAATPTTVVVAVSVGAAVAAVGAEIHPAPISAIALFPVPAVAAGKPADTIYTSIGMPAPHVTAVITRVKVPPMSGTVVQL